MPRKKMKIQVMLEAIAQALSLAGNHIITQKHSGKVSLDSRLAQALGSEVVKELSPAPFAFSICR